MTKMPLIGYFPNDIGPVRGPVVFYCVVLLILGVVGCVEGVVYLITLGRLTEISLQLGKACYPCSR